MHLRPVNEVADCLNHHLSITGFIIKNYARKLQPDWQKILDLSAFT